MCGAAAQRRCEASEGFRLPARRARRSRPRCNCNHQLNRLRALASEAMRGGRGGYSTLRGGRWGGHGAADAPPHLRVGGAGGGTECSGGGPRGGRAWMARGWRALGMDAHPTASGQDARSRFERRELLQGDIAHRHGCQRRGGRGPAAAQQGERSEPAKHAAGTRPTSRF